MLGAVWGTMVPLENARGLMRHMIVAHVATNHDLISANGVLVSRGCHSLFLGMA
jgi:hypothetical protein